MISIILGQYLKAFAQAFKILYKTDMKRLKSVYQNENVVRWYCNGNEKKADKEWFET